MRMSATKNTISKNLGCFVQFLRYFPDALPAQKELRESVGPKDPFMPRLIDVFDRVAQVLRSCIIHQDINPANKAFDDLIDNTSAVLIKPKICSNG